VRVVEAGDRGEEHFADVAGFGFGEVFEEAFVASADGFSGFLRAAFV